MGTRRIFFPGAGKLKGLGDEIFPEGFRGGTRVRSGGWSPQKLTTFI